MKYITILLTWRFLRGTTQEKNVSTMVFVCFLGIAIGSFALALVTSVMQGFEQVTHEKMQGIHAQIIIRSFGDIIDLEKIKSVLDQEFPAIRAFSPSSMKQVIIQKEGSDDITNVIMIKGIDPKKESNVSTLESKIIAPSQKKLVDVTYANHILIGKKLATLLECEIGDPVNLIFVHDEQIQRKHIVFDYKKATIGGLFTTGIDEFDQSLIFCSLDFFTHLFPDDGITQINVRLYPGTHEAKTITQLKDRLHLDVYSWKDLYPALVSALKLEKYAMFFILAIIILVASMNIISLLFMQITQKRGDIAILKVMGLPDYQINSIFLYIGIIIALLGSITGLSCAFIAGILLQQYPFITLPDVYYTTHLPVSMSWHLFVTTFIVIIFLSTMVTWLTTRKAQKINIAEVLRFEA